MTTTVSTNLTPFITFVEQASTPTTPAAGNGLLYRKTDNNWYFLDDGGNETAVSTGAASGYVLQSLADAKGDLIIATADNTFAKHTAPADGSHLVADSAQSDGWSSILHKYAATAAPAVTDDSGDGYAAGSFWFDTTNDKAYVCLDASVGAAVWTEITSQGVLTLDGMSDVNAPTPSNGDVLTWDSTPGEWVASAPTGGASALDDLTDVNAPTPTDGYVLTWDSGTSQWVAEAAGAASIPPALKVYLYNTFK